MNTRPSVLALVTLATLALGACTTAGPGGSSTSSYSYSAASSAMMQTSSMMSVPSSAMMESSSSSVSAMMQGSSAMMEQSSMSSNASLAADNATAVLAVQNFYLGAMHQSDPVGGGFVASSRYLTDAARTSLQAGGNTAIYCANKKPSTFTLVAIGASQTQRNVVVTESFHDTPTVDVTVSVVHQSDGWKIDGVACGASSAASSQ